MRKIFLGVFALSIPFQVCAEATLDRIEKKIDTIDKKIDVVSDKQKDDTADPLNGKRFGVEINFARLITDTSDDGTDSTDLSGTFSFFPPEQNAEIAFPWYFANAKDNNEDEFLNVRTIDAHYRYFLGSVRGGFYLSGFGRLAFLHGSVGDNFDENVVDASGNNVEDSTTKVGLGVGIGYRIFSKRGPYWGASLSVGQYVSGENDHYVGNVLDFDDDARSIIDVELLKFGWAF